jgi:putative acetyltransferase
MLTVRPFRLEDVAELAALFRRTVLTVNRRDYTAEQVEAWAAADTSTWAERLMRGRVGTVVAVLPPLEQSELSELPALPPQPDRLVGFIQMVDDPEAASMHIATPTTTLKSAYLDLLFVHADYQRRGIAAALYSHAEAQAQQYGVQHVWTQASLTARPFFERVGFVVIAEQTVRSSVRADVTFTNYRMEKLLEVRQS